MNFGNSPLLDMGTSQQQPQMMDAELQKMYEAIQQKRASINMQAQQSSTPLWDEIDKIEDNLTGAQRQYLMQIRNTLIACNMSLSSYKTRNCASYVLVLKALSKDRKH